ncbi:MAG: HypC/HybG/HupF family hydrogenase formation chaperone [Pseudanabaena sp. ELA607]|jgi:hydrogenase expression/formation protein HypC
MPGQIVAINQESDSLWRTGKISFGGVFKQISLAYVPEAQVGDYVIVHVGFALSIVDQEEAKETLSYLQQMSIEPSLGEIIKPELVN